VVNRFEVHLVTLDPTRGSEIRKTRPFLIVSPNEMNRHVRTVLIAPMTTGGSSVANTTTYSRTSICRRGWSNGTKKKAAMTRASTKRSTVPSQNAPSGVDRPLCLATLPSMTSHAPLSTNSRTARFRRPVAAVANAAMAIRSDRVVQLVGERNPKVRPTAVRGHGAPKR